MAEARASLSATGWLAACPEDFRKAILDAAIVRSSPRGQAIVRAGEDMGGLFAIAGGTAEVTLTFEHPDTEFVHLVHRGFWAGYRPLIGRQRLVTVTARDDLLWVLVPRHAVRQMLDAEPAWWRHIAELADDNVEMAAGMVADLTRQDNVPRVAAILLRLAGCHAADPPPDAFLSLRLSQSELAGLTVMSRNTLNAILQQMVALGLLQIGYRTMTVLDPRRLRALLDN